MIYNLLIRIAFITITFSQFSESTSFGLLIRHGLNTTVPLEEAKEATAGKEEEEKIHSYSICLTNQFICKSGQCIEYKRKCDGRVDCVDNSDELNCNSEICSWNQFRCSESEKCISKLDVCNGIADCYDGSDEQYCSCGVKPPKKVPHVVGGLTTNAGDWPWMVALIAVNDDNMTFPFCGGTLISNLHVLSAAHCITQFIYVYGVNETRVRFAEHSFGSSEDSNHLDFSISDIRIHEQFDAATFQNDIAIIRINRPITFTNSISRVCLPNTNDDDFTNKTGILLGWGQYFEDHSWSKKLQYVKIRIWSNKECSDTYKEYADSINNGTICAGDKKKRVGSCQGDSGGPLIVSINNKWQIVGIVAWGVNCAIDYGPTACTRVSNYLQWILNNTNACSANEFKCSNSRHCIPTSARCDCKIDCIDNSDELNCDPSCVGFTDRNTECIPEEFPQFSCRCKTGFYELFQGDPCGGCRDPCIEFSVRNAICSPIDAIRYNCSCKNGHVSIFDNDPCRGCKNGLSPIHDDKDPCPGCEITAPPGTTQVISTGNQGNTSDKVCPSNLGYGIYPGFGCLKVDKTTKSWRASRSICIRDGGDLFTPGTKYPILPNEQLNLGSWYPYWIGVKKDGNGPFKRVASMNQTELPETSSLWNSDVSSSEGSSACVFYDSETEFLGHQPCRNYALYFICQIFYS